MTTKGKEQQASLADLHLPVTTALWIAKAVKAYHREDGTL